MNPPIHPSSPARPSIPHSIECLKPEPNALEKFRRKRQNPPLGAAKPFRDDRSYSTTLTKAVQWPAALPTTPVWPVSC